MTMTERDFHIARRMFIVKDGTVLIAPSKDSRSHAEWLFSLLGAECKCWINTCVRGYYLNGQVVAYLGENFSQRINHNDFMAALAVLEEMYDVKEVGFGAIKGGTDPIWPARTRFTIKTYKEVLRRM